MRFLGKTRKINANATTTVDSLWDDRKKDKGNSNDPATGLLDGEVDGCGLDSGAAGGGHGDGVRAGGEGAGAGGVRVDSATAAAAETCQGRERQEQGEDAPAPGAAGKRPAGKKEDEKSSQDDAYAWDTETRSGTAVSSRD
jgi:hypothetical protein